MALDIGRIAYQARIDYVSQFNRELHPKWEEIGKIEQDAWRLAACAVLNHSRKCEEEMKNNPDAIG